MKEKALIRITKRFDSKSVLGYGVGPFVVTAEIAGFAGQSPYFSVTCDGPGCGGCMHREAVQAWPEIKPVVDMHLCTYPDGAPSHSGANGWYYMSGALPNGAGQQYHVGNSERHFYREDGSSEAYRKPTPDECLLIFAEYVRVPMEQARQLRERIIKLIDRKPDTVGYKKACAKAKAECDKFIDEQRPRWNTEALAIYGLMQSFQPSSVATIEENRDAKRRRIEAERNVKRATLKGVPPPVEGSVFKLVEVRKVVTPHPFVITSKHIAMSSGSTLDPNVAPCGYPECRLSHSQHVEQKALFIMVPQNSDLNSVPGLNDYLKVIKPVVEPLGITGFAFPTLAQLKS